MDKLMSYCNYKILTPNQDQISKRTNGVSNGVLRNKKMNHKTVPKVAKTTSISAKYFKTRFPGTLLEFYC